MLRLIISLVLISSQSHAELPRPSIFKQIKATAERIEQRLIYIEYQLRRIEETKENDRQAVIRFEKCEKLCESAYPWSSDEYNRDDQAIKDKIEARKECYQSCEKIRPPGRGSC